MNLTDPIKTLKTDLDRVEDLVASGDTARADAVLFRLNGVNLCRS